MKKCLHISSTTPATLHLATGDSFYVGDKKVHLLTQNNLFATFEPKNNKYLTYSFNLPAESNNVVKVVPYYNGHYDITLSPTLVSTWSTTNQVYSKTYGKIQINVHNDDSFSYIDIMLEGLPKFHTKTKIITNIVSQTNSFVVLIGDCGSSKYVLVLDENFDAIVDTLTEVVEDDDTTLKVLLKLNDIARHGKVYEFDKQNNSYNSYLVYLNDTAQNTDETKLIPLAMLEALQCGNLKLAKSYMLNDNIDDNKLLEYFGKVKEVYFNVYDTTNINYTVVTNTIKSYNFTLQDNKIADIDEVSLTF